MNKRILRKKNFDFDYYYLLILEQRKLKRMLKYFKKHNYVDTTFIIRDILICINLLNIINSNSYTKKVNLRNCKRFNIPSNLINNELFKDYICEELAVQKAFHLYNLIRQYRMQTWWD